MSRYAREGRHNDATWCFCISKICKDGLLEYIILVNEEMSKPELINVGGELKERTCDSLVMCIVTTLNQGLRNGGGIGDILRAPSSVVSAKRQIIMMNFICSTFIKHRRLRISGTIVRRESRVRFTVLLHRDHYCFESHLRCDHRHLRGSQIGEAAEGIDSEKHVLYLRQVFIRRYFHIKYTMC